MLKGNDLLIKNFIHKGLKKLYADGSTTGIEPVHRRKLKMILARLETIQNPSDMNLPGFYFHPLQGSKKKKQYAVKVDKNWRVIFKFDGTDAYDVDYIDYH